MMIKYIGINKKGFIYGNLYQVQLANDVFLEGFCPQELESRLGVFCYETNEFIPLSDDDLKKGTFELLRK